MNAEEALKFVLQRLELTRIRNPQRYTATAALPEIDFIAHREAGTDKDILAHMLGQTLENLAKAMLEDGTITLDWDRDKDGNRRLTLTTDAKKPS